ncbi:MAG: GtrA family protein [Prevotella sp.]|nr:GtrA family protein [Prevotella sp.]
MKNPFSIFTLRREERWPAVAAMIYIVALNALVINRYVGQFTAISDNFHRLFVRTFHVSGFDPLTYSVVSAWGTEYNIYRHPLLAFMMWPLNQLNQGIMMVTGYNGVQFVVAALLVFCAFYAFVFLCRIFREIIGVRAIDAWLLGALTYSFAFVMLSSCVPDHFVLSMFMLVLTLYVAGRKMQTGRQLTLWQSTILFFLTAGISLNNGIKVLIANLFVNGRRFWRPRHLLLAVVVPCALIWGVARAGWYYYERPNYMARQQKRAKVEQTRREKIEKAFRDTTHLRDTAAIRAGINRVVAQKAAERKARDSKKAWKAHIGKPMGHGEFSQWTDISTPRWASMVENFMGESIQLHQDHLLEDNLTRRPVIVTYRCSLNYIVEALLALLVLAGVWCGRRSRLLWLAMSFLGFDLVIHVVLGFGLNEVYIMSAHWLFTLTIALGFLFKRWETTRLRIPLRLTVLTLTLFLMAWNWTLLVGYLAG